MKKALLQILTGSPPRNTDQELYGTLLAEGKITGEQPYKIKALRDGLAGWARLSIMSPSKEVKTVDYIVVHNSSDIPKCWLHLPQIMFLDNTIIKGCVITIRPLKEMI